MAKIVSFIIQKGGCGKTTTTVNIGGYLAEQGYRVLMIDMDPQGNMTHHLGIVPETLEITIRNVLKKSVPISEAIIKRSENLDVIGNNILTSADEITFLNTFSREYLLRDQLTSIMKDYDYILIDCPPSLGILSLNSLVASHEMFIVVAPDFFPLMALKPLLETFDIVREKLNVSLKFNGIAITMCDMRTNHAKQVVEILEKNFPDKLYHSVIRQSVSLKDASGQGKTVFEYDPKSSGAEDYRNLGEEFIKDNLSVQKKHHKLDLLFQRLNAAEKEQIEQAAVLALNQFNRERIERGDQSDALVNALKLSRNRIIEQIYRDQL
jgi:chromosome partitioning protein